MSWRLLTHDGVDAAVGLAADECLTAAVGRGEVAPSLRLYTYRPHAALVGRFQDAAHEVHLDYCREHGIAVGRRPTGGGAILMGPDQLGVALALRGRGAALQGRPRELMAKFSAGLVEGLASLGVHAAFRGKNDLEVEGRKIAGLGIYRDPSGGLLFHGSLLVDLDVELMARVLVTPFAKVTPAEVATVAGRTSTVRKVAGAAVTIDEVRERVARGFARTFGVELVVGTWTVAERAAHERLAADKYDAAEWVYQSTAVADLAGRARQRTAVGLLDVSAALAGSTIKSVMVRGDFFASEGAVADLEGLLRWHPADPSRIRATVARWTERHPDAGLDGDVVASAVVAAAESAAPGAPYGCFVTPEVARG